jgi:predicted amidohydrolase YtcJ
MTPSNDASTLSLFREATATGSVLQHVHMAGTLALNGTDQGDRLTVGPTKIHLHESALPEFGVVCETIAGSHDADRPTAIHCVTELELVFALAALREVGAHPADRIEHASVTPPVLVEQIRELDLTVVTQPNFIAERGDAYRGAFAPDEQGWLYRCQGFLDADIRLAGGTDAPFGSPDPWLAMRTAVARRTHAGQMLGASERLTPEAAVSLFLGSAERPDLARRVEPGTVADLCLLSEPWHRAREVLSGERVRLTIRSGELIHDRVDQTPIEGTLG